MDNPVTPPDDNERSLVEECLTDALSAYLVDGTNSERQLAQLAIDLIHLTGDQQIVVDYINLKASKALEGETAW